MAGASSKHDSRAAERGLSVLLLVPGGLQLTWRQRRRALVFFSGVIASLFVGVWCWGSPLSFVMLACAYALHSISTVDAFRQWAFPGFGRVATAISGPAALALGGYVPAVALAMGMASPEVWSIAPSERYLVNRWAYRSADPNPGQSIWFTPDVGAAAQLGRVVAGAGSSVEWRDGLLRVDGEPLGWMPSHAAAAPNVLSLKVPENFVLVAQRSSDARDRTSSGLLLIERRQIVGQAWGRIAPFGRRGLL